MERTTQSTARVLWAVLFVLVGIASKLAAAEQIGVCYGTQGSNLPSRPQAISLVQSNHIGKVRIYSPDDDAMNAMKSTNLEIIVGILNPDLQNIANNQEAATAWVRDNIVKYSQANIKYITVGNEVFDHPEFIQYLMPAMKNIQSAINAARLQNKIKVSTPFTTSSVVLSVTFPISNGTFADEGQMKQILQFLSDNGAPFMAHIYPYYTYIYNKEMTLEYALFKPGTNIVNDNGRMYDNVFDALFDSFVAAMGKIGFPNIPIVVTETGWPSDGGDSASVDNAQTYINNLIKHVLSGKGTPVRGGITIPTYIFALFNEDQKTPPGIENHFGLFNPDSTASYPVNFTPSGLS